MEEKPFRWDIVRREQLGRLVHGPETESYPEFLGDLRTCAARVVATSDDADLIFVGRSPESIFDYLSGIFLHTSRVGRMAILNLSFRNSNFSSLRIGAGLDVHILRRHLASLGLSPQEIATREHPVALIDLVAYGGTFAMLTDAILAWAKDEAVDAAAVIRRLRFHGITWRTKTSPNTWRWQQKAEWLRPFRPSAVRNVSIPGRLWDYLGNTQHKVSRTQPPDRWRDEGWRFGAPHEPAHIESLRLALRIFDTARSREEQRRFTTILAQQPSRSKPWLRTIVAEVRKTSRSA